MKVVDIQFLAPSIKFDPKNDCIDIIAKLDDGQAVAIAVCTASFLPNYLSDNDLKFLPPDNETIIVESLTIDCVTQAVYAYSQNGEFCNRVLNTQQNTNMSEG